MIPKIEPFIYIREVQGVGFKEFGWVSTHF